MLFLDEASVRDVERDVQRWADLWPADGSGPDGAEAVSLALALGIAADDRVEALAVRIRDGIDASAGRVIYDLESARAVERLTTAWLEPAVRATERVAALERAGLSVPGVAEYRDRVIDARFGVSVPVERAAKLARRWSRDSGESGTTTEELRDAVRSRVG